MRCGRCGNTIPPNSKFCLNCGAPVSVQENRTQVHRAQEHPAHSQLGLPPKNKKKIALFAAISGVVLVALIFAALFASGGGVMDNGRVNDGSQSGVLNTGQQPDMPQTGVLDTDAKRAPIELLPGETKQPPADVVAYLQHVQKVEEMRRNMRVDITPAFKMLQQALGMKFELDEDEQNATRNEINSGIQEYTKKWQDIVTYFNSVPAPASCSALATSYGDALGKYSSIMVDIQGAMENQDVGALTKMQGSAQADVDSSLMKADSDLASVCSSNGIKKTFSISPDKGVESLMNPLPQ